MAAQIKIELDSFSPSFHLKIGFSFLCIFLIFYFLFNSFNPQTNHFKAHFSYVDYFSRYLPNEFKLPSENDTREFFNPPLGYLVPSIAQVLCRNVIESTPQGQALIKAIELNQLTGGPVSYSAFNPNTQMGGMGIADPNRHQVPSFLQDYVKY